MEFSDTIIIHCPASAVWQYLTDLGEYPFWYPGLSHISGTLAINEKLQMEMRLGRRQIYPSVRVIGCKPGAELAWRGSLFGESWLSRLFYITRRFEVYSIDAENTQFTNYERFSGIIGVAIGGIVKPRLKTRYRSLNQAFKSRCESTFLEK